MDTADENDVVDGHGLRTPLIDPDAHDDGGGRGRKSKKDRYGNKEDKNKKDRKRPKSRKEKKNRTKLTKEEEEPFFPDNLPMDVEVPSDWSGISKLESVHRRHSTEMSKQESEQGESPESPIDEEVHDEFAILEDEMDELNDHVINMEKQLGEQKERLSMMEKEYKEEKKRVKDLSRQLVEAGQMIDESRRRLEMAQDARELGSVVDEEEADLETGLQPTYGMDTDIAVIPKKKRKTKQKIEESDHADPEYHEGKERKETKRKKTKRKPDNDYYDGDEEDSYHRRKKRAHKKKKKEVKRTGRSDYKELGYRDYRDYKDHKGFHKRGKSKKPKRRRSLSEATGRRHEFDDRARGTPSSWPARTGDKKYASARSTPDWLTSARKKNAAQKIRPDTPRPAHRRSRSKTPSYYPPPIEEEIISESTGACHCDLLSVVRVLMIPMIFVFIGAAIGLTIYFVAIRGQTSGGSGGTEPTTTQPNIPEKAQTLTALLPQYTLEALTDVSSPQARALEWSGKDAHLETYSNTRKIQRFALATFYYSTFGMDWTDASDWISYDVHECNWFSNLDPSMGESSICEADENGDLIYEHLVLSNNNLQGALPKEIALLAGLRTISLFGNIMIAGDIPTQLGQLTYLQKILIYQASLMGTVPSELTNLSRLVQLELYDNLLTGHIPRGIGNLRDLFIVQLQFNKLDGTIPKEVGFLTNLRYLYLFENTLSGPIPSEIGGLSLLQHMYLYFNRLDQSIPTSFGQLESLERLWVDRNDLDGKIPSELGLITTLTQVSLHSNMLTGPIPEELAGSTRLEGLLLWDNRLTGSVPEGLCSLKDQQVLQVLSVDCPEVTCGCGCACGDV